MITDEIITCMSELYCKKLNFINSFYFHVYVFWREGKSRCTWRKIKVFMLQKYIEEEYKRRQDHWICFKKGSFAHAFKFHSPKNNWIYLLLQRIMKFHFTWIAIHLTDNSNINIMINKTKMKICSKPPLSKNSHHAEASQLIFIECQMTGLHMTQSLTEQSC